MKQSICNYILLSLCLIAILSSCSSSEKDKNDNMTESQEGSFDNPLLQEWTGPFGGVPAFDNMQLADLQSAIEKGMELNLAEIDAITSNSEPATFENTILPYEVTGEPLSRAFRYYSIWSSNMANDEFREIQQVLSPKISEFRSKIQQNEVLFNRIKDVYDKSQKEPLGEQEQRIVDLIYKGFVMRGADLDKDSKERYAAINKELSTLYTNFSNNVLADEEGYVVYLEEDQLGGLSESFVSAIAAAAAERGQEGKYAITNTRSAMDPFLTYSTERDLREIVWRNYYSRGDNNDEHDNKEIIAKILQLRHERVQLLGEKTYGDWRLQDRMAKTPENALELMNAVWPAAIARVQEEVADMQRLADAEGAEIKIEPWDYRYYAEKVRQDKYDLDSDEVKQYLQLDKLREAMFYVAGELFGYDFSPITDGSVPVFHEDVKVWEVTNKGDGSHRGLWYLDPYARQGKRSGAWASTYRSYAEYPSKQNVLASNNSNFIKGAPGEPVLVSWDDATTFFHEFGHALHFLSSNIKYPTLDGGVRDYTEFQSQLLERWLSTDEVIEEFLVHHETGKPMPEELIAKINKASTFNQGFSTTEYLASALMDMKYHSIDPKGIDVAEFEKEYLKSINMPAELPMRHRSPHFGHIFSGEGYAAAYYGYMWADVLTSDAAEAFVESPDGFYDKALAEKMVKYLFSPRNLYDPADAYRMFRGRDAKIEALMKDRGFPVN
ncbi:MAG: M3 family metallopeptidase [Flavobacteriales bacterium]|nr:M3 family metallopeptidase [Flavobacteriales bacterium]